MPTVNRADLGSWLAQLWLCWLALMFVRAILEAKCLEKYLIYDISNSSNRFFSNASTMQEQRTVATTNGECWGLSLGSTNDGGLLGLFVK